MVYLNTALSVCHSPEVLSATDTQFRAWFNMLVFCAGQENGGRISGCRNWPARKWSAVVRVSARVVARPSDLWQWQGDDVVVAFYPLDNEAETKAKRAAGRKTANKRWGAAPCEAIRSADSSLDSSATSSAHAKRKGKKSKGKMGAEAPEPRPAEMGEDQHAWIARLKVDFPGVDIDAELVDAQENRRKQRKRFERAWFVNWWLPNCSPEVTLSGAKTNENPPKNWQTWLVSAYPDCVYVQSGECIAERFAQLPQEIQKEARTALSQAS